MSVRPVNVCSVSFGVLNVIAPMHQQLTSCTVSPHAYVMADLNLHKNITRNSYESYRLHVARKREFLHVNVNSLFNISRNGQQTLSKVSAQFDVGHGATINHLMCVNLCFTRFMALRLWSPGMIQQLASCFASCCISHLTTPLVP